MLIRAEYRVGPELKYLSNLDMIAVFHRSLRRARLPYALSQGFNPHIKMSMGIALPVGLWSEAEYFDLELTRDTGLEDFQSSLNQSLPQGLRIIHTSEINDRTESLMVHINCCQYRFIYDIPVSIARDVAQKVYESSEWIISSRGKKKNQEKDLRSGIISIMADGDPQNSIIDIIATVNEPLNVRFDELLELLSQAGMNSNLLVDVYKTGNYHKNNGSFLSPMNV